MTEAHEKRQAMFQEARNALELFLASPNSSYLCDYLELYLNVETLMRPTPEATANAVGKFEVIQFLRTLQKQVRGEL